MIETIISELIGAFCLLTGCVLYLVYERKKKILVAVLSIIFTALGIGLVIGSTNKRGEETVIEEYYNNTEEEEIDP